LNFFETDPFSFFFSFSLCEFQTNDQVVETFGGPIICFFG
jgi:hypothetical protein